MVTCGKEYKLYKIGLGSPKQTAATTRNRNNNISGEKRESDFQSCHTHTGKKNQ